MRLSRGRITFFIRKWTSLIEVYCDVKTKDGYILRLFAIGYTYRKGDQARKTSYAKKSQIKEIRRRMINIIQKSVQESNITELIQKLVAGEIADTMKKQTNAIHPLKQAFIYRVKVLKKPKMDGKRYQGPL